MLYVNVMLECLGKVCVDLIACASWAFQEVYKLTNGELAGFSGSIFLVYDCNMEVLALFIWLI